MSVTKRVPTIVNLSRHRIDVCNSMVSGMLTLNIPDTIINDLEVIDSDGLTKALADFFKQQKVAPSELILVLSPDICFDRDLTDVSEADRPAVIQSFIDLVPLSSVSYKVFSFSKGLRLVVINRKLYDSFKTAFSSLGFSLLAVIPGLLLFSPQEKEFTAASCHLISKKIDFIKENSFLAESEADLTLPDREKKFVKRHHTFMVLISVVFLLYSAVMLAIYMSRPVPRPAVSAHPLPVLPSATPLPTPFVSPTATPSANLSVYKVQILNGSPVAGLASQIEKQLRDLGFTQITTGNSPSKSATTLLVFSSSVPSGVKEVVSQKLQTLFSPVSIIEKTTSSFDIQITLVVSPSP